ncbi:MAG: nitroreductase family protein [Chloroflexota bacterium]
MDLSRLSMPLGEAMLTHLSIRRYRPDPIAIEDIHTMIDAASKAPSGGNHQPTRYLYITDRAQITEFGALYKEAWWAKRRDQGGWQTVDDIPEHEQSYRRAAQLADEMKDVPCVIFALAIPPGGAGSVLLSVQNLLLAARALGIGTCPTTLHPSVMDRFNKMFGIPDDVQFHFCIPVGYPRGKFGPNKRMPTSETTYQGKWGQPVPWS